jgi:hypothetical protein
VLDSAGPDLLRPELLATSCLADWAGEAEELIMDFGEPRGAHTNHEESDNHHEEEQEQL